MAKNKTEKDLEVIREAKDSVDELNRVFHLPKEKKNEKDLDTNDQKGKYDKLLNEIAYWKVAVNFDNVEPLTEHQHRIINSMIILAYDKGEKDGRRELIKEIEKEIKLVIKEANTQKNHFASYSYYQIKIETLKKLIKKLRGAVR